MAALRVPAGRALPLAARGCSSSTAEAPLVVTGRVGAVTTIALNDPARRNCLSGAAVRQLTAALLCFERDDSSPAAVLHGKGGNFCSGRDLRELAAGGEMAPAVWRRPCAKPVVAALDGYAVGAGLALALWCDLRVVEETAVLGAFGRRFGVPLLDGGAARLAPLVGLARALDLLVTGRGLSGVEAFEWGLASRLVACGTAVGQAVNLAASVAKFPPAAVAADRRAIYHATFEACSLDDALQFELENGRDLLAGARDGARRFVDDGVGRHGKFNIHPERLEKWNRR